MGESKQFEGQGECHTCKRLFEFKISWDVPNTTRRKVPTDTHKKVVFSLTCLNCGTTNYFRYNLEDIPTIPEDQNDKSTD